MPEFINLVPEAEKQEQQKEKLVKLSTVVSIVVLILCAGVSAFIYFQETKLKTELSSYKESIEKLRGQVKDLSSTEITARNLYQKFTALNDIYQNRVKYSILVDEFAKRTSSEIDIVDFTLGTSSTINISGTGDNYISVAKFMKDLTAPDFVSASPLYNKLFTSVTLNAVNLADNNNRASFFIVLGYDNTLLIK